MRIDFCGFLFAGDFIQFLTDLHKRILYFGNGGHDADPIHRCDRLTFSHHITVAHQILMKSGRDEQAMLVSVAGIIIALLMLVNEMGGLFDTIRNVFGL